MPRANPLPGRAVPLGTYVPQRNRHTEAVFVNRGRCGLLPELGYGTRGNVAARAMQWGPSRGSWGQRGTGKRVTLMKTKAEFMFGLEAGADGEPKICFATRSVMTEAVNMLPFSDRAAWGDVEGVK